MITFTHVGSCVSRDIFNFINDLEIVPLFTHNGLNIPSLLENSSLEIDENLISSQSRFWLKMQKFIFNHPSFEEHINKLDTDYFIFDLGGERLPLQQWTYNGVSSKIPVSWETYNTSNNIKKNSSYAFEISDWHLVDRNIEMYKMNLEMFADIIKEKYDSKKIIYVSVRQANYFINNEKKIICNFDDYEGNGIERKSLRKKQETIIEYAEKIILNKMPKIWLIESPNNILADDRHHFGRHTLHFNHLIYEYYAMAVNLIVQSNNLKDIDELVVRKKIDFLKKYTEIRLEEIKQLYK